MIKPILLATLALGSAAASAAGIQWVTDYRTATQIATKSGKLVMAVFVRKPNVYVAMLNTDALVDPAVIKASSKFVCLRADVDKGAGSLANTYGIVAYPNVLFLKPDGKVVWTIPGYEPPNMFLAEMNRAPTVERDFARFKAKVQKNSNDVDALLGLVPIYAYKRQSLLAVTSLSRAEKVIKGSKERIYPGCNSVGDYYQTQNDVKRAIPYFEKGLNAKDSQVATYSAISISACYQVLNTPQAAVPALKSLLKRKDLRPTDRRQAEALLTLKPRKKPQLQLAPHGAPQPAIRTSH